jgi:meso-butanediol dehydrogenase/(S,S)-butanediol dehydrogenase/diacetyl reductase
MSNGSSDGRVVLITGGARGIGRGMAAAFLAAGHRVMIGDLTDQKEDWTYSLANADDLSTTVTELTSGNGPDIAATPLDVTDAASCKRAVEATLERFGQLDVLVNNAGVVDSGPVDEFTELQWDRIFDVNVKGIFLMSQAAVAALRESSDAAIVITASIAGKRGSPNMSAYCGSKFAAIGITQSLAQELAPSGIRVNALCPGVVGTAMWIEHLMVESAPTAAGRSTEFETRMEEMIPLGRAQTAQDMGEAAVYLATAKNVSGVALAVAGGLEMH